MIKTGFIYLIKNIVNNKIYIGQTLISPFDRWKEHIKSINRNINSPLYEDVRKYGIENFTFQILEENISSEYLDKKECFYIKKYESIDINKGYNISQGGKKNTSTRVLDLADVENIILMIKKGMSFIEIAKIFNVNPSTISDINNGDTWYLDKYEYPINEKIYKHKNFNNQTIQDIYKLLRENNTISMIAEQYLVSKTTISKINKGIIYHQKGTDYPIKEFGVGKQAINNVRLKDIAYKLSTSKDSLVKLARLLHIDRGTLSSINNGVLYQKELAKIGYTKFPIKKNI